MPIVLALGTPVTPVTATHGACLSWEQSQGGDVTGPGRAHEIEVEYQESVGSKDITDRHEMSFEKERRTRCPTVSVARDSALPPAPVAGGSNSTASTCSAVLKACDAIRAKLFHAASTANEGVLAGRSPTDLNLTDGRAVASDGASEKLENVFKRAGATAIEEYAEYVPPGIEPAAIGRLYGGVSTQTGGPEGEYTMYGLGAEFIEVRIHSLTREIRVPRIVGAFAAGRIMNTRTARSQYMGGMIWGISSALNEATEIDRKRARYVNDNLADYLMPVNADIQELQVRRYSMATSLQREALPPLGRSCFQIAQESWTSPARESHGCGRSYPSR